MMSPVNNFFPRVCPIILYQRHNKLLIIYLFSFLCKFFRFINVRCLCRETKLLKPAGPLFIYICFDIRAQQLFFFQLCRVLRNLIRAARWTT